MSATTRNPYRMPQGFVSNPFAPLYQQPDEELSEDLSVQLILDYANELDDKIAGDLDLGGVINEIKNNTLSFVRTGLLAFKVKVLKLYREGYRTFKDFCEQALGLTHWQINRTIEAARVVIELAQNGFDVLPKNEAQARPLTKFTLAELCANWQTIVDTIPEYKITNSTINKVLGGETKTLSIRLSKELYKRIKDRALELGVSVEELLESLLGDEVTPASEEQIVAWEEDLERLTNEEGEESEPIGKVSTPKKSEPIVTVSDTLASEQLTEESLDEAPTPSQTEPRNEQFTNTQTPISHQNKGSSDTHLPSSSNQASTSVLTEHKESAQPLPAKKPPKIKSFLDFHKGSSKKKRNKRGFGSRS